MKEITKENSMQFAAQFELFKLGIHVVDWEYGELLINRLHEQANLQETMSIFNPSYPLKKNDVLRVQAEALRHLVEAVKMLQQADALKKEVANEVEQNEKFKQMFV